MRRTRNGLQLVSRALLLFLQLTQLVDEVSDNLSLLASLGVFCPLLGT